MSDVVSLSHYFNSETIVCQLSALLFPAFDVSQIDRFSSLLDSKLFILDGKPKAEHPSLKGGTMISFPVHVQSVSHKCPPLYMFKTKKEYIEKQFFEVSLVQVLLWLTFLTKVEFKPKGALNFKLWFHGPIQRNGLLVGTLSRKRWKLFNFKVKNQ